MWGCVGLLSQRGEIHLNHPFRWFCPCQWCWGWIQSKGRGQSGWPPPSWTSTLPSCLSGVLGMGQDLASCTFSQELPRTWWERWLLTTLGLASASFIKMPAVPGLPWWRSGWESAGQCRGHGFEPWSGKIPHAAERLGPWATTTEPARLEPVLRNKRGRHIERPAHRDEERPLLAATRESPRTETKTQHSQKIIN